MPTYCLALRLCELAASYTTILVSRKPNNSFFVYSLNTPLKGPKSLSTLVATELSDPESDLTRNRCVGVFVPSFLGFLSKNLGKIRERGAVIFCPTGVSRVLGFQ